MLAERCLTRARIRAPVLGIWFFAVTSVTADGLKIFHYLKNDVSFYGKQRVVLWKVTCRFMENNVLFLIGGRKVVLRMVFWGFLGVE